MLPPPKVKIYNIFFESDTSLYSWSECLWHTTLLSHGKSFCFIALLIFRCDVGVTDLTAQLKVQSLIRCGVGQTWQLDVTCQWLANLMDKMSCFKGRKHLGSHAVMTWGSHYLRYRKMVHCLGWSWIIICIQIIILQHFSVLGDTYLMHSHLAVHWIYHKVEWSDKLIWSYHWQVYVHYLLSD